MVTISLFYRWGNWGTESLKGFLEVTSAHVPTLEYAHPSLFAQELYTPLERAVKSHASPCSSTITQSFLSLHDNPPGSPKLCTQEHNFAYRSFTSLLNNMERDLCFSICVQEPRKLAWILTVIFNKLIIWCGDWHVSSTQESISWGVNKKEVAHPHGGILLFSH